MRINEVEERVGVTKRNIRYYEKEGLLSPERNSENGYRDYTEEDVEELKRVKLLRKLDLPLEEIRRLQTGTMTLTDGMRRHLVTLERAQTNLSAMQTLCAELLESGTQLAAVDCDRYLAEMEQMEQEGTRFVNIKKHDTRAKYISPLGAALVFVAFMAGVIALLVWAFTVDPADAPPLPLLIFLVGIPAVVIVGVVVALVQRFKQIKGGEEDAASQY